jgi:hypothetical protein
MANVVGMNLRLPRLQWLALKHAALREACAAAGRFLPRRLTGHKPEDAVPVAEPGAKSLHLQGRTPKHRHLSIS